MIQRLLGYLFSITLLYTPIVHSGSAGTPPVVDSSKWNGLYLGGNIGYLWSVNSWVQTTPTSSFFNPDFFLNGEITRRSLVRAANQTLPVHLSDLTLGVQAGYNYEVYQRIVAGVTADFDWLLPSSNSAHISVPVTFDVNGLNYTAAINARKTLSYLGTVRGRLGALFTPEVLIYGTGGFAYGRAALTTTTSVINTGSPGVFPAFSGQDTQKKVLDGWTAGGGFEWMFLKNWSTNVECLYYELGRMNSQATLTKWVNDIGGVVPYASTNLSVFSLFSTYAVRVAINGHFD